ncbi:hypothetical protein JL720_1292 [Aureococcus anophagefferens]|nr:hypothetical protein JL720_1292 [Aureococcus anophagefferens]
MVNTPRQKAYAMGGKRHSHDHEGIGVQQSSVGALIGKSDAAMKKRLGISDADEARRTVETLAACGGVSALAAACGSSVGDFGSGLWTGDDVARACGAVLEANGRAAPSRALEFLFRAARTGGAHAGSRAAATPSTASCWPGPSGPRPPAVVAAKAFDAKFPGGAAPAPALGALVNGAMPPAFLDCFRVEGGAVSREAWVDGHVDHCRGVRGFPDAPGDYDELLAAAWHAAPPPPPRAVVKGPAGTRERQRRSRPDDASGRAPPRPRARALAVDVEVTLDAMRLALTQGTVESGLAVLAALKRRCAAHARGLALGDFRAAVAAVFAGRSRPPDASLRVLFDALSAAPPGAHLSDARVVAPAALDALRADKRPARPRAALADAALAALGGPASVGALLANYAASKHPLVLARALPAPKAADLFRESLAAAAALDARADVSRRAFLDACADLSYCCGDGPDGDAKYALRLGPPCGAATAARRRDGGSRCTQVHIGDDGGPAAEGVATREKRKVWRKPAPAAARTRDFSGVSLRHGPDLSLSSLTHDPVSPRLRPAAQTAHTGLHTSSWSIGDGGC